MATVIVTGSSRGIGLGIAKQLARQGFNLVLNAPKASEVLEQAEHAIKAEGGKVTSLALDIAELEQHQEFIEQALEFARHNHSELTCLVNNAGVSVHKRADLLDMSIASFDEQIAVNLRGTFFLTQTFAKTLLAHNSKTFRSIITISSSNAVAASVERGEYCMSKSALSMMNKLFAVRLAEAGINCYEVRPGLIETDMTLPVKEKYDALIEKGFSPINRWGLPEDVAEVVANLAKGAMKFSTGEALHLDGGLLISRY